MDSETGAGVAAAYHDEVVGPLLARELPGLRYAAARLGSGSDVLGFDDGMSRDHDWGCRLTLLVDEADRQAVPVLDALLESLLPQRFRGLPTRFPTTWDPTVRQRVDVGTVGDLVVSRLGRDPLRGLDCLDWLTFTGQAVLEVTGGPVFADTTTELGALRAALAWYPPDVERYLIACGWHRLSQRMPIAGRTAGTGQPLQSRLLCAGLVDDLVDLAFLLHRRWSPYEKWREAAFARLPGAGDLAGPLSRAVAADAWPDRQAALVEAIGALFEVQRGRGLPVPEPAVVPFYDRPYLTVSDDVPRALLDTLTDPLLRGLPKVGGVGQWADCVDVLGHAGRRAALTAAYRFWST